MLSITDATRLLRRDLHDPSLYVRWNGGIGRYVVGSRHKVLSEPSWVPDLGWLRMVEPWDQDFHIVREPETGEFRPLDGRLTDAVHGHHVKFTPKLDEYVRIRKERLERAEKKRRADQYDMTYFEVAPEVKLWANQHT